MLKAFYREASNLKALSRKNMIVAAAHSHTAPSVANRPGSHPEYVLFAAKKAAESLRETLENMKPGEIFSGITLYSDFFWGAGKTRLNFIICPGMRSQAQPGLLFPKTQWRARRSGWLHHDYGD